MLIVGRQKNGEVTIINAFQGKEAFDIYEKLITAKKGGGNAENARSKIIVKTNEWKHSDICRNRL